MEGEEGGVKLGGVNEGKVRRLSRLMMRNWGAEDLGLFGKIRHKKLGVAVRKCE